MLAQAWCAVRVGRRGLLKAKVFKAPKPAAQCTRVRTILLQHVKGCGHLHPDSTASGLQNPGSTPSGLEVPVLELVRSLDGRG